MRDEELIGKNLIFLTRQIERKINKGVSKYGITGVQGHIIGFLYNENKKRDVFQKDLEESFHIRKSSVTSVLNLMESNGLIKREINIEDARLKKIVLTEKGIEIHKSVMDEIDEVEKTLQNSITKEELNDFINIILKLYSGIKE